MKMRLVTIILILSTILLVTIGVSSPLIKRANKKPTLNELLRIIEPNKSQKDPNIPDKLIGKVNSSTDKRAEYNIKLPEGFVLDVNSSTDKRAEYNRELLELKKNPEKYTEVQTVCTFMAELVLAEAGYDPGPFDGVLDERTQTALRAYQKNRGIPVTGDPLSYDTLKQLEKDKEIFDHQVPYLASLFVSTDMWDYGYVSAKGTWTISGEKQGFPEQTSEIECFKDIGKCIAATAILHHDGTTLLEVQLDIYNIERWDEHEIVTKPRETAMGCVRYVYRFNRLSKSVTGTRSTISDEGLCKGLDKGEKHLVLVDGFEITRNLMEDLQKKRRDLIQISPSLLKTMESGPQNKTK
jgi:hypothetical protein